MSKLSMLKGSYLDYPFKKGQKIDGITILRDNFVKIQDRYKVEFKCRCGKVDHKRLSHLLQMKYKSCKHCARRNFYPEQRDCRNLFTNELHNRWLILIKENLNRGNRHIKCFVTNEDLKNKLIEQDFKCTYTGIPLKVLNIYKRDSNASIDRINSDKDYTYDNIQWVYKPINIMKNGFSDESFKYLCKKVANFIG